MRVPPIQIPPKKGKKLEFFEEISPRTNLMALLVTLMGSRYQEKYSKF
jgi:hypothetical protein